MLSVFDRQKITFHEYNIDDLQICFSELLLFFILKSICIKELKNWRKRFQNIVRNLDSFRSGYYNFFTSP